MHGLEETSHGKKEEAQVEGPSPSWTRRAGFVSPLTFPCGPRPSDTPRISVVLLPDACPSAPVPIGEKLSKREAVHEGLASPGTLMGLSAL